MLFIKVDFLMRAKTILTLPDFKGAVLRSAFGKALRDVVCITKQAHCKECFLQRECAYTFLFEPGTENGQSIPPPYIFEAAVDNKTTYMPGDEFPFSITLLGEKSISQLALVIAAVKRIGSNGLGQKRGKLTIKSITNKGIKLYNLESNQLITPPQPQNLCMEAPKKAARVLLHFITPTAIKTGGQVAKQLTLEMILSSLKRRIRLLGRHHGFANYEKLVKFERANPEEKILLNTLKPYKWERYSARQKQAIPFEGVVGELLIAGQIDNFVPLLKAGEVLHVGRGTVYGMGQYKMRII
jgi:hypothetical protein